MLYSAQGSIRLIPGGPLEVGDGSFGGRLELLYNGSWGIVCDDDFSYSDIVVACRQLGFAYSSKFMHHIIIM